MKTSMEAARRRLVQNAPKVAGAVSALENPETATEAPGANARTLRVNRRR